MVHEKLISIVNNINYLSSWCSNIYIDMYFFMLSDNMDDKVERTISIDNVGLANQQNQCASSVSEINRQNEVINAQLDIKTIGSDFINPINEVQSSLLQVCEIDKVVSNTYAGIEYDKYLQHHSLTFISENSSPVILGDTGASSCMFPWKEVFITLSYYQSPQPCVFFGDKRSIPIMGYGNTSLCENAYYVPDLKLGVMAIS